MLEVVARLAVCRKNRNWLIRSRPKNVLPRRAANSVDFLSSLSSSSAYFTSSSSSSAFSFLLVRVRVQ